MSNTFIFSMPGGSEWIVLIFGLMFFAIFPILIIVLYVQVRGLKKKNKELIEALLNRPNLNAPQRGNSQLSGS